MRALADGAARALAHEHVHARRLVEASRAAERALSLAPESEALAGELLDALAAAGDRLLACASTIPGLL